MITSTTTSATYSCDGVNDTFAYNWKVTASSQLRVIIRDAAGGETLQAETTHYTVSGVNRDDGGNVVFNPGNIPAADEQVYIEGYWAFVQKARYPAHEDFPSSTHEAAMDYMCRLAQQLHRAQSKMPVFKSSTDLSAFDQELPDPLAGYLLGINSTGDGFDLFTGVGSTLVSAFMATLLDDADAAAALTTLGAAADSAVMKLAGGNTVTGAQDLTGAVVSVAAPTADAHAARRQDVDDSLRGVNLLINSNFGFDQRGGPHIDPADDDYTLDRWVVDKAAGAGTAPAVTLQQNTVNAPEGSAYCCELVITSVGADGAGMSWAFVQRVEEFAALAGKEVTFSLTVEGSTDIDLAGSLVINDGVGYTAQAIPAVGATAERISVTHIMDASATALYAYFQLADGVAPSATGSIYLSQAKLEVGDAATPYIPPLRADELARCLRYYEVVSSTNRGRYRMYMDAKPQELPISFMAMKRVTPTVTASLGISAGGGTPAAGNISTQGFSIETTPTVAGNKRVTCQATADAEI